MKKTSSLLILIALFALCSFARASACAYQLPDTGQKLCYDEQGREINCPDPGEPFHGQDAQYQGEEPAYQENNGNGTVTDLNTGLIWQQTGDGTGRAWQEACEYCDSLNLAGHQDWRIPDRRELFSLVDYGVLFPPRINTLFDCQESAYWSGSSYADFPELKAWSVSFAQGTLIDELKNNLHYVRCVRDDASP